LEELTGSSSFLFQYEKVLGNYRENDFLLPHAPNHLGNIIQIDLPGRNGKRMGDAELALHTMVDHNRDLLTHLEQREIRFGIDMGVHINNG